MKFSITFLVAVLPLFVEAAPGSGAYSRRQAKGDLQKSLTLDKSVIAKGFALTGQEQPTAGQAASLTSTNNFINFCALTLPNKPITDGQQIKTGSCNPTPMGVIASTANMPSAKFVFPPNGGNVAANTAFTIQIAVKNLALGTFTNAQSKYYAAPQQVNGQGNIIGHTHVTIEKLTSLGQTTPMDPNVFAFFKGINTPANGQGVATADVTAGLPAGPYRLCSINSSSNHQPVLVAVAQHGSLDDCVYFTVGGNGAAGGNAAAGGNNNAAGNGAAAGGANAGNNAGANAGNNAGANAGNNGGNNGQGGRGGNQGGNQGGQGRGGNQGGRGGQRRRFWFSRQEN